MRSLQTYTRTIVAVVMAGVFSAACSDSATAPLAPNAAVLSSTQQAYGAKSSTKTSSGSTQKNAGATVNVLSFKSGVKTSTSASKVIGPEGGYLTLPETGFTLIVPMGAVSVPTTFTVTPVGGKYVAYDFEPHGSTFKVPLTFMQDLSKTNYTSGTPLGGAYFSDKSLIDTAAGSAGVSELFTLSFDGFGVSFFSITHFSGYLVSMG